MICLGRNQVGSARQDLFEHAFQFFVFRNAKNQDQPLIREILIDRLSKFLD